MYYILNQLDQVVAVAPRLLNALNIPDVNTFYQKLALKEVTFTLNDDTVTLRVDDTSYTIPASVEDLEGMIGNVRVVNITSESLEETASAAVEEEIPDIFGEETPLLEIEEEPEEETALLEIEEEPESAKEMLSFEESDLFDIKEQETEPVLETTPDETLQTEAENLYELTLPSETENAITDIQGEQEQETEPVRETTPDEALQTEAEDLYELTLPSETENAITDIQGEQEVETSEISVSGNGSPIYIDIENISEKIGITPNDYNLFLNEYIDTALGYEQALISNNDKEKEEALNALSHLSNVLQLPTIGELLSNIREASQSENEEAINTFFAALGRLSTAKAEKAEQASEETIEKEVEEPEEQTPEERAEEAEEQTPEERAEEAEAALQETETMKRPPIDLTDIKPIHFDFQLEEAAKDLSLPIELIEEFVNDFISQAHEETEKMLKAYERGDLERVQKIGHLLKGTASNLRINPLADTLYEIQFNEDLDRVPELVKNYWGHFLSLENQIKLISNK